MRVATSPGPGKRNSGMSSANAHQMATARTTSRRRSTAAANAGGVFRRCHDGAQNSRMG